MSPDEIRELLAHLNPEEQRRMAAATRSLKVAQEKLGPVADVAYQTDPIGWIRDVLGVPEHTLRWSLNAGYDAHAWDGTPDPLVAVAEGLVANQNVGVESATTTGKTFLGACIVLWFLACFENAIVVTVAPKADQLKLHIWKEISRLWARFQARFPSAEMTTLKIRMRGGIDETWAASGFVAGISADEAEGSAAKAQGFHARDLLIVFEETPGVPTPTLAAFKHTCRAPHNLRLAFGNPNHILDELHQFCVGPRTRHVVISAYDHPNVVTGDPDLIPGAVSQQGIDDALEDALNDGGAESRMFKSRVRGISPAESVDALIRTEWLEAAAAKYQTWVHRHGPRALGVDVANSENGDKAAIAHWIGDCLEKVEAKKCPNANKLGDEVLGLVVDLRVKPEHVGIDGSGIGGATVNVVHGAHCFAQDLNGAAKPIPGATRGPRGWEDDTTEYANLRAQMWFALRNDLRLGRIALPKDLALWRELTAPTFEMRGGKVLVESKDDIKPKLGGKSPDRADAVVYGNWVRARGAEETDAALEAARAEVPAEQHRHPGYDVHGQRMQRRPRWMNAFEDQDEDVGRGFQVGIGSYRMGDAA